MPTDDERRGVAKHLRAAIGNTNGLSNGGFVDLVEEIVFGGDVSTDEEFFARLADLIDPTDETCELELTWGGHTNAHVCTYECTGCGKSCDSVWGEEYEFCPYCGRKVENADE